MSRQLYPADHRRGAIQAILNADHFAGAARHYLGRVNGHPQERAAIRELEAIQAQLRLLRSRLEGLDR